MSFRTGLAFFLMGIVTFSEAAGRKMFLRSPTRLFLTSGVLVTMLGSVAQASAVFDRLSGPSQRADQCFVRYYDAAHLKQYPRQRVTRFHLRRVRGGPDDVNNQLRFTVAIGFRIIDGSERFEAHGICTTRGPIAECDGEGDSGSFRIALVGQNLRVEIKRLELEGSGADLAESDDRIFMLLPARAEECQR